MQENVGAGLEERRTGYGWGLGVVVGPFLRNTSTWPPGAVP